MIILSEQNVSRLTPKGALFCALDRCILEDHLSDEQILEWAQGYIALLRGQVTLAPLTEPVTAADSAH